MTVQAGAQPRVRSSFAAAFLSSLFPGLGQAYAGVPGRGLAFAAAPLLLLSLAAGVAIRFRVELLGVVLQPVALVAILIADLVFLVYRLVASVDAWRVAGELNAFEWSAERRVGRPRLRPHPLSTAGLAAVLLVIAAGHLAVAALDLQALDLVSSVFGVQDPTGTGHAPASPAGSALITPGPVGSSGPTAAPATAPPWNGADRLNILLVGADQRPPDPTFNTDTMIVLSIDPATHRVAMFSLPRDTVDVPLPAIPARAAYGPTYPNKINSLCTAAVVRPDLFPAGCFQSLKQTLGTLLGLDISYYVEVNFYGFKQVVDTLGGVTINVQNPVVDDLYPTEDGTHIRLYIPTGVQHMDGSQALAYARSRHGSTDFDRAARQQRVILSMKEDLDFQTIFDNRDTLIGELKGAVHTDFPVDKLPQLIDLIQRVDTRAIQSLVFTPPVFQQEILSGDPRGYVIIPYVDRIRAAVSAVLAYDPAAAAQRAALAKEGARIVVLNGSGQAGQAGQAAAYLSSRGLTATASAQKALQSAGQATVIEVDPSSASRFPQTLALLAQVYGVQPGPLTDQVAGADIVVVTGATTPALTPVPTLPTSASP
ncbi:MAG TPA: LCP family protein [Candidatus Limnocylindrales bacterium]